MHQPRLTSIQVDDKVAKIRLMTFAEVLALGPKFCVSYLHAYLEKNPAKAGFINEKNLLT